MSEAVTEKKIELRVIAPTSATDNSPYRFKKTVDMVIMRCATGDMGILPGRVPVSTVLGTGVLRIFDEDTERHMAVMGGVAHVGNNIVTVLSDEALKPEEIDKDEVTAQMKELQQNHDDTTDLNEKSDIKKQIHRCKILLDVAATFKRE